MIGNLSDVIRHSLGSLPHVERVYIDVHGDLYNVTTIVDDEEESTYNAIYEREGRLIDSFRDSHFDFHVIARRGRALEEIVDACPNVTTI